MERRKLLIDTNIFIAWEDAKEVPPAAADLLALCSRHAVQLFIHEAAMADIQRDQNTERRKVSLSKLRKFNQLVQPPLPAVPQLIEKFGTLPRPNDLVDVALLHALDIGAVDFLVTEDQRLHSRARLASSSLGARVLRIADAIDWVRNSFEPRQVRLPLVEEVAAHVVPASDEIFESLRDGYPDFDDWWRKKCVPQHRKCWVVTLQGELAGLVVRKDERHEEAGTLNVADKILKLCTFKVKPKFRGEKLGELLLKQALWFAQLNGYKLIYLTTFPSQSFLIDVIQYYGFRPTITNNRGETLFEKVLTSDRLALRPGESAFEAARLNYPRFSALPPVKAYCVPIQPEFHDILFPEFSDIGQLDLFSSLPDEGAGVRAPGNTIRKVYLSRSMISRISPGSVLAFYCSKPPPNSSHKYATSQSITTIGVAETITQAFSLEDLVRLSGKRSVYALRLLQRFQASRERPVKVLDFLLIGHLRPPLSLNQLLAEGGFNARPPQSISTLSSSAFKMIKSRSALGFEV